MEYLSSTTKAGYLNYPQAAEMEERRLCFRVIFGQGGTFGTEEDVI